MMNENLNKDIQKALMKDVDLSPEEYRKKNEDADQSTKTHGVKGRTALTEGTRHKRIQMNFYGTMLNIMCSMLAEVSETNRMMRYLLAKSEAEKNKVTEAEKHVE